MEFRYRAIDTDRPPTSTDTSSTPSHNLFLSARPNPAIQREIEKEQIRQEIISAETSRRRELIAEVVQELAIEREIAIRRVLSLDDKLLMLTNERNMMLPNQIHNNNNVQNQNLMYTVPNSIVTSSPMTSLPPRQQIPEATTEIMESNKEKLIVLNRPDTIGTKRKAEDTQTGLAITKHKTDSVGVARNPQENKDKENGERVPLKQLSSSGKKVEIKPKLNFKFWCEICGVGAFSQTVMRNHELGKKHIAATKKPHETAPALKPEAVTVPEVANVEDEQRVDEMAAKETRDEKSKKVSLWCEICNIRTYSEKVMETHKLGKRHKTLIEKQQHKQSSL